MILAIDVGNTNIVLGVYEGENASRFLNGIDSLFLYLIDWFIPNQENADKFLAGLDGRFQWLRGTSQEKS
jgi:hypothetical protein